VRVGSFKGKLNATDFGQSIAEFRWRKDFAAQKLGGKKDIMSKLFQRFNAE
jgi:hypothetical protein